MRRIGRVEHQELRAPFLYTKGLREDFGTKARTSHPEQHRVGKSLTANVLRNPPQFLQAIGFFFHNREPANPFRFIGVGPEPGVACPELTHLAVAAPVLERSLHSSVEIGGEIDVLAVELVAQHLCALARHRAEQLVEGVGKRLNALLDQFSGHGVNRDIGLGQAVHHLLRLSDTSFETICRLAVIAERIHGRRWHRVHGVVGNQLVDIENVAIISILGAGAGPQ